MTDIYWNSHRKLFSVREKGKVSGHVASAFILQPQFIVSEKGRQRVVRDQQKNVHAVVRGVVCETNQDLRLKFIKENRQYSDYSFAVYDPYDECGCFRVQCVFGDILVQNTFAASIKMVHAYTYNNKPCLKVKMCN
jgi:hypothetical protein